MTAQEPDLLEYEGRKFGIYTNPLGEYFEKVAPSPNFVPESTSNWRGYVAEWKIRADRLYLTDLSGHICVKPAEEGGEPSAWCRAGHLGRCDIRRASLESIFGDRRRPIFAEWFTGEVVAPQGEMIEYVHLGYGSRFERYLVLDLENGVVKRTRILGNEAFEAEHDEFRKTQASAPKTKEKSWWRFW